MRLAGTPPGSSRRWRSGGGERSGSSCSVFNECGDWARVSARQLKISLAVSSVVCGSPSRVQRSRFTGAPPS